MSKFLTAEVVATRPDASYFSAETLSMLRRIFDSVCEEENITSEEERDYLATNLLEASKFSKHERTLIAVMKYDIAGFRK